VRFRYVVLPTRVRHGPWREDPKQAREDALEAGLASRDEHDPRTIFLDELVAVEGER
jgi:hypothetical protein